MIFEQLTHSSWPLSYPERRSREMMRIQEQQRRREAVCPPVSIHEPPVFTLKRLSPEEAGETPNIEDIVNEAPFIKDFVYEEPVFKDVVNESPSIALEKYETLQCPRVDSIPTRTPNQSIKPIHTYEEKRNKAIVKKESWGNNWLDDLNAFKNQLKRKREEDNDKSPIKAQWSGLHEPKKPRSTYQIKSHSPNISTVPKALSSMSSLFLPPKQQTLPQEVKKPTAFQVDKNRASSSSYSRKPPSVFSKQVTKPQEVIKPKNIQKVISQVSSSPSLSLYNQKLQTKKNMPSMPSLFAPPKQATKLQEEKTVKEVNKLRAVKKPEEMDSSQASCSPLPSLSNQQLLPSMPSLLSPPKQVTKLQEIKMAKEVQKPQEMDSVLFSLPNQKLQTKKNMPSMPPLFAPPKQVTKLQELKMAKEVTKPQKAEKIKKPKAQWNRKTGHTSSPLLSPQKENRSVLQSNQKRMPSTVSPPQQRPNKQVTKQPTATQSSSSIQIASKRQPFLFPSTKPMPLSQNSNKTETVATDQSASIHQQVKMPSPKYPVLQNGLETPNYPSLYIPTLDNFQPMLNIVNEVCQSYEVPSHIKKTINSLPLPSEDIVNSIWGVMNEKRSPGEMFKPIKAASTEHVVMTEDLDLLGLCTDTSATGNITKQKTPALNEASLTLEGVSAPTQNILKENNNVNSPPQIDLPKNVTCRIDLYRIVRIPQPIEKNEENIIQTHAEVKEESNSEAGVKQAFAAISSEKNADIVNNSRIKLKDEVTAAKPRYRSYFEKDEKTEALRKLLNRNQAFLEAAHCICAANQETNTLDQLALDLEAAIYFVISADGVTQNFDPTKILNTFRDALTLTKIVQLKCGMSGNITEKEKISFKRLEILNMRCRSLVFLKLYEFCRTNMNEAGKQECLKYISNSHDLWDASDVLAKNNKCIDFFVELDLEIGPLTMHSNVYHILRYVQQGLDKLSIVK